MLKSINKDDIAGVTNFEWRSEFKSEVKYGRCNLK